MLDGWGVETGGVYCTWPGTINGKADARFADGPAEAAGGAEAEGKRPRARRAASRGFSGTGVMLGCAMLFVAIWGMILGIWGGGVGCWRAAVFFISSASVPGLRSCWRGCEIGWLAGGTMGAVDMAGRLGILGRKV